MLIVIAMLCCWKKKTATGEQFPRSKSAPANVDDATCATSNAAEMPEPEVTDDALFLRATIEDTNGQLLEIHPTDEDQEAAIEDVRLHRRQEEELQRKEEKIQRQEEEIQRQAAELQRQAAELQRQEAERLQNERLVGFVCNGDGSESNLSFKSEEEHIPKHVKKDIYDRNERTIMEVEHLLEELNAIDPSN